jgi:hypothetical protein
MPVEKLTEADLKSMTETAEMILAAADQLDEPPPIPDVGFVELHPRHYHRDPCATPSLNQSIANVLVTRSPLHAWHLHPRLGAGRSRSSKSQTDGTILHELLLGGDRIAAVARKDFRTKAAKAERDNHLAMGRIPILQSKLDPLRDVATLLRDKFLERGVDFADPGMRTEVSAFWMTDSGVRCRARLDALWISEAGDRAVVYDLKMTANAHPAKLERSVEDYGYALQRAAYIEAVECIRPDLEGRVSFEWLFAEPEQPHAVTIAEADPMLEVLGSMRWERACELWAQCLELHDWPDYAPRQTVRLGALPWVIKKELEE